MRTISIRMPDTLHRRARALSAREGISLNELVVLALAEKVFAVTSREDPTMQRSTASEDIRELFPGIVWPDDASGANGE